MEASQCVFCSIISGLARASIIYQDSFFIALLDKYPFSYGHTLVIPRKHYTDFLQMPENEVGPLYRFVWFITNVVSKAVKPEGFNIGQNNGRAANQIIPHVHIHIIPRFKEDIVTGKWPARHPVNDIELENISQKIKSVMLESDVRNTSNTGL
jgi:histidine triad (HIT) family protein